MWIADFINKTFSSLKEDEVNQWEYEGHVGHVPIIDPEKMKPIKHVFLNYVERNNSAWEYMRAHGPDHPTTLDAFEVSNDYKRKLLDMLEER